MKVELYKNLVLDQIGPQEAVKSQDTRVQKKEAPQEVSFKLTKDQLKELTEHFKDFLNLFDLDAKIVYDKRYDTLVVQVMRKDTGEVIRQIPPEELLRLSQKLHELAGILLENKA